MDLEDLVKITNSTIHDDNNDKIMKIVKDLFNDDNIKLINNREDLKKILMRIGKNEKVVPSLIKVLSIYRLLCSMNELKYDTNIERMLRTKNVRSLSGVVVITVFTSPYPVTSKGIQQFSCEYDCHYCPKEPNQPRSYLLNEPGVLRANNNNFISTEQFWDRARSYILMGHPLDKIELIVSGGTFSSYPREYITNFFRDQFYAANIAYQQITNKFMREPLSLAEEQDINQNISPIKIIGITIETRPDRVNEKEIIYFRKLGVTRVQIGVQHIDDRILDYINRKCKNHHTIKAIKALKESGFKVDIHLMPDLPHPDDITALEMVELDRKMFMSVLECPEYQADQWKIYPCATVPWTEIEKWYNSGKYKPYGDMEDSNGNNLLFELIIEIKQKVKPWIRLNRVIRDIPNSYIMAGNQNTSMRNDLAKIMQERNVKCKCIRCTEVKSQHIDVNDFKINVRQYPASDGIEYFITWNNLDDLLLGFLRLRINSTNNNIYFPELSGSALIRELHVYGQVINHNNNNKGIGVQHIGLGKALINKAIEITKDHKLDKISVIAGVGVRNYYIKQEFLPCDYYFDENNIKQKANGNFLIKNIKPSYNISLVIPIKNFINYIYTNYLSN